MVPWELKRWPAQEVRVSYPNDVIQIRNETEVLFGVDVLNQNLYLDGQRISISFLKAFINMPRGTIVEWMGKDERGIVSFRTLSFKGMTTG
jgi:hypothetical protein